MGSFSYEKILGTAILAAGLVVIGYSINLGINVFIKTQSPPEIFKPIEIAAEPAKNSSDLSKNAAPKNLNEMNPVDLQNLAGNNALSPEMLKSIIPPEMFSYVGRMLNLSVFSIFLWVLITAGAKISALGISLIKTNASVKV